MILSFACLIPSVSSRPADASALESAISALERDIAALEGSSAFWEHWLPWFTGIVALGVAMEFWVIRRERRDDMQAWKRATIRSPERPSTKKFVIELVSLLFIAGGIVGELGIGITITSINGLLRSKGAELRSKSDQLLAVVRQEAGDAETSAKNAAAASQRADADAGRAKNKADDVAKLAEQLVKSQTPRSLTQKEMNDLRDALKPLADPTVPILVTGSWESGLPIQVWHSLKEAGFQRAEFRLIEGPLRSGMSISAPMKHGYLASEIAGRLSKAGIGPEVGLLGVTADNEPLRIFIGDIRTGPLPSLK